MVRLNGLRLIPALMIASTLAACDEPKSSKPAGAELEANTANSDSTDQLAERSDTEIEPVNVSIESGATVTYGDVTHDLMIQMCSVSRQGDGSFNVWAITPDSEGTPTDGPRLHVYGQSGSSTMRFFTSGSAAEFESTFAGDAALAFEGAVLVYDGKVSETSSESIAFRIQCRLPD